MTDSDGNSYIDAIGGLFLVNVGHGRTKIAEAVADQLSAVHYANTFMYPAVSTIKLSKKLAELAPGDLNRVFLASGGSEAVDTALKIIRQYHVNNGEPRRTKFIARRGSYHGVSVGALSMNSAPQCAPGHLGPDADRHQVCRGDGGGRGGCDQVRGARDRRRFHHRADLRAQGHEDPR